MDKATESLAFRYVCKRVFFFWGGGCIICLLGDLPKQIQLIKRIVLGLSGLAGIDGNWI